MLGTFFLFDYLTSSAQIIKIIHHYSERPEINQYRLFYCLVKLGFIVGVRLCRRKLY